MKNSDIERQLVEQFKQLVIQGNEILRMAQAAQDHLDGEEVAQISSWLVSTKKLLGSFYLDGGPYLEAMRELEKQHGGKHDSFFDAHANHYIHLGAAIGILQGAHADFKNGSLRKLQTLVRAEVFSDIMEAASHLLEQGYKDAAAVFLGGVLELTVKRMATEKGIPLAREDGSPKKLQTLNEDLAKRGHYNGIVQKQVTAWAAIRNDAAHGDYDNYREVQVKEMQRFLENFCQEYL